MALSRRLPRSYSFLAATAVALLLTGCGASRSGGGSAATARPAVSGSTGNASSPPSRLTETAADRSPEAAAAALAGLAVKGRAPMTGYSRARFGPAWFDEDHNGCDTRNDILRRDLSHEVLRAGGCLVQSGTFTEPYSGRPMSFERGAATSGLVQIDHVVALGDAWQTGAQQMSAATRQAYANDPLVLLAVSGVLNDRKGDADAASWLPPNKAFRCTYVARQIAIKARYRLWVTPAEKSAMAGTLATCPGQRLPSAAAVAVPPIGRGGGAVLSRAAAAGPRSSTTPASTPVHVPKPATSGVYYANCAAVRAAGKAPLLRGQPGYAEPRLDRNDDGVACS
jgi:hypothetical protein